MLSETVVWVRISFVPIVSPLTSDGLGVQFCLISSGRDSWLAVAPAGRTGVGS